MRPWLMMLLAVVASALLLREGSSAYDFDHTCPGAMGNRGVYDKVSRVCVDCANIYRLSWVDGVCRNRCFNNFWFMICLMSAKRENEIEKFRLWISILNPGGTH